MLCCHLLHLNMRQNLHSIDLHRDAGNMIVLVTHFHILFAASTAWRDYYFYARTNIGKTIWVIRTMIDHHYQPIVAHETTDKAWRHFIVLDNEFFLFVFGSIILLIVSVSKFLSGTSTMTNDMLRPLIFDEINRYFLFQKFLFSHRFPGLHWVGSAWN